MSNCIQKPTGQAETGKKSGGKLAAKAPTATVLSFWKAKTLN
jgi:hypothetical protein